MWRKPENKDEETQVMISRVTRKMNRKSLLNKFAQKTAETLAKVLVRPDDNDIVKISFAAGPCRLRMDNIAQAAAQMPPVRRIILFAPPRR